MAFADWNPEDYQVFTDETWEIFNNEDFRGLSDEQIAIAEELFEQGWLDLNASEFQRHGAREAFSNIMRYTIDFRTGAPLGFDWGTFREAYDTADATS